MRKKRNIFFGAYLQSLRIDRKLSKHDVWFQTGIDEELLTAIENGFILNPSPVVVYRLAKCYNIEVKEIMKRLEKSS